MTEPTLIHILLSVFMNIFVYFVVLYTALNSLDEIISHNTAIYKL